jgi:hypothetical protein
MKVATTSTMRSVILVWTFIVIALFERGSGRSAAARLRQTVFSIYLFA